MSDVASDPIPPPDRQHVREPWPPVNGTPGTTQGRYGRAGNLELVAPAVDDGLWVGWFNADPEETYQGAAVGSWSGALRFGRGMRYVSATIAQVQAGPDFLEVLAMSEAGELRRHVWTPTDGFVDHGAVAHGVSGSSGVVETPDGDHVVAVVGALGLQILSGRPGRGYPVMTLESAVERPGLGRLGRPELGDDDAIVGVDAAWHVRVAGGEGHLDVLIRSQKGQVLLGCASGSRVWTCVAQRAGAAALAAAGQQRAVVVIVEGHAWLHVLDRDVQDAPAQPAQPVAPDELVDLGPAEAVALAAGRVHGRGPWQVVLRSGDRLRHVSGGRSSEVTADGWAATGMASLHRG